MSRTSLSPLLATSVLAVFSAGPVRAETKVALVELYTSQGCNMCPAADAFLGELGAKGSGTAGANRIVALAFHVDYFNKPWKDVHSDPVFSQREMSYNQVQKREDLYFTPMMMVDGQVPMLGTDKAKAKTALAQVLKQNPGVSLKLSLEEPSTASTRKTLKVAIAPLASGVSGREVLVGVATFQDAVTTEVKSGENAGKTLVEHYPVRRFAYEFATLPKSGLKDLSFPLTLESDWPAEHCGVAVFVQDKLNGRIFQADSVPWTTPPRTAVGAR